MLAHSSDPAAVTICHKLHGSICSLVFIGQQIIDKAEMLLRIVPYIKDVGMLHTFELM